MNYWKESRLSRASLLALAFIFALTAFAANVRLKMSRGEMGRGPQYYNSEPMIPTITPSLSNESNRADAERARLAE